MCIYHGCYIWTGYVSFWKYCASYGEIYLKHNVKKVVLNNVCFISGKDLVLFALSRV